MRCSVCPMPYLAKPDKHFVKGWQNKICFVILFFTLPYWNGRTIIKTLYIYLSVTRLYLMNYGDQNVDIFEKLCVVPLKFYLSRYKANLSIYQDFYLYTNDSFSGLLLMVQDPSCTSSSFLIFLMQNLQIMIYINDDVLDTLRKN